MSGAAHVLQWMHQRVSYSPERVGESAEPHSRLGLGIAIISHERGIPRRRQSSAGVDSVPALCTHRPSLLPIALVNEPVGWDPVSGLNRLRALVFAQKTGELSGVEEVKVVTRYP